MSAYINGARKGALALTVSLATLFLFPGCSDQLLPVEPVTDDAAKVVFTEINDMFEWQHNAVIVRAADDGSKRVELTDGFLPSPPGTAGAALLNGNGIWLAPVNGSAPVVPQLVVNTPENLSEPGSIDPYSVVATPSGTRITYTTNLDRTTIIAGAGASAPVTMPRGVARETTPSFSRDGSRMAFFSHDDIEQTSGPGGLYVVNVDGTGLRKVEKLDRIMHDGYTSIDWSPSGDRLAYFRRVGSGYELRVTGADGSGGRTLADNGAFPVWSPSGDSIIFIGPNGSGPDLFITAADGSGTPRLLTSTPTINEMFPRFSPDGTKVLYTAYAGQVDLVPGQLTVQDLATGTTTILSSKAYKGFWVK